MKKHELKTWNEFMRPIANGAKTFEVRKDDRNFCVGDCLILMGYHKDIKEYTGQSIIAEITYKVDGGQFGIEKGFCVMGIDVKSYNF